MHCLKRYPICSVSCMLVFNACTFKKKCVEFAYQSWHARTFASSLAHGHIYMKAKIVKSRYFYLACYFQVVKNTQSNLVKSQDKSSLHPTHRPGKKIRYQKCTVQTTVERRTPIFFLDKEYLIWNLGEPRLS